MKKQQNLKEKTQVELEVGRAAIAACDNGDNAEVKKDPKTGTYKVYIVKKEIGQITSAV